MSTKNGKVKLGTIVEGEIKMEETVDTAVVVKEGTPTISLLGLTKGQVEYLGGAVVRDTVTAKETKFENKSDMFRALYDTGYTIGEISALCTSHYSFVYGVVSSSREITKTSKDSKSDSIRALADQGKTPGEIAKELNSNYSFVHSVVKKYKAEQQKAAQ